MAYAVKKLKNNKVIDFIFEPFLCVSCVVLFDASTFFLCRRVEEIGQG
jgi:hypothetical protein